MIDLTGKVAVITGAADAAGQGYASASVMGGCGAAIVVSDIRSDVHERAAELRENGTKAIAVECDVRVEGDVAALVTAAVDEFGRLDILHSQAADLRALADPGDPDVINVTMEDWSTQFDTIALGTLLTCKYAIPAMLDSGGGGSIICTTSVSGELGEPNLTAYGMAKAAVNQLVRSVSSQYGNRGIRANAIAPGLILSAPGLALGQELIDQYSRHSDVEYVGDPMDTAHVVAFLASDLARLISGEVIRVDGGYAQHSPMLAEQRASARMVGGQS